MSDISKPMAYGSGANSTVSTEALQALRETLIDEIGKAVDGLAFVHGDDGAVEHLEMLRCLLTSQVNAYVEHLMIVRATLTPHISVMYAEAVGAPGIVATTFRGLLEAGTLSHEQGLRLMQLVGDRRTLVIFGDGYSGRSTLLNTLFEFVSVDERCVAFESGSTLPALKDRSFCLRLAADDGADSGALFARARGMDPARIVVDELHVTQVRGFFGLLGGPKSIGGMCTLRASSVSSALEAIATGFDGDVQQARELIAGARPVFAHMRRDEGGSPRLAAFWSVEGLDNNELVLREIETSSQAVDSLVAEV